MNKKLVLGGAVAGMLIFGFGSAAGASGKAPAAAPAPAPTVTVTAEPVYKTVTVEKTPKTCIDSLDKAGAAIGLLSEVGTLAGTGIQAAYDRDSAALQTVTSKVQALNTKITGATPSLAESVRACRDSAK